MFRINLNGRECISCGICMDVCAPRALGMRSHRARMLEGATCYGLLGNAKNVELPPEPMMTFPYLAAAELCNGCGDCVEQCPTCALKLLRE